MNHGGLEPDPTAAWRQATPARIGLGRAGAALPTAELLRFGWAHATARDAVLAPVDFDALQAQLEAEGWPATRVRSQAADRADYLRRPDRGRRLNPEDAERLRSARDTGCDVCIVLADGLSAFALERQALPLLGALRMHLPEDWRLAPLCLAQQARVAIGDEIGEAWGARLVIVLIGERPGLSSPDSLGAYLTHAPRPGRTDAERNCVSNIRPAGQPAQRAAARIAWLAREALHRQCTGVALKDDSDRVLLQGRTSPAPGLPAAPDAQPPVAT